MKTRYFIAFAAAAMLLSGCEENEMRRSAVNDGWLKIKIAGLQMTKGTLYNSEAELLDGGIDTFTVAAWNADYSSFVSVQKVSYDSEASKWKLAEPKMWTGSDVKTFFAYTNLPGKDTATISQVFTEEAQKQTLFYQLPLDARKQNDIMLGAYQGTGGGTSTADITFFHPLTSVIFRAGTMPDGMAINKVTLSGIYAQGSVDVTYTYGESGPAPHYNWGENRKGSVEATLEPVSGTEGIEIDPSTKIIGVPFVVFPQEIAAGDVQIILEATLNEEAKTYTVDVPAVEWKYGYTKTYLLNCDINANFTVTVTPWDADSTSLEVKDVVEELLLPGKFSISETEYVQFSRGNLQFKAGDGSVASPEWQFAEHQYDYIGNASGNTTASASRATQSAWIDIFGWGATGRTDINTNLAQPYETTANSSIYKTEASASTDETLTRENGGDWGVCMGEDWFTLSTAQWQYLFGNSEERKGKYKLNVTVCGIINCLIIVPDVLVGYTFDSNKTSYTAEEWATAEAAGLVCLPSSGRRSSGTSVGNTGVCGQYWSSSADSQNEVYAQYLYFNNGELGCPGNPGYYDQRWHGRSVRLVQKFEKPDVEPIFVDLGLPSGTLWANVNLGAKDSIGEKCVGKSYMWGYVDNSIVEYVDGKTSEQYYESYFTRWGGAADFESKYYSEDGSIPILVPEDDAAMHISGGKYRMPTIDEWKELFDYCDETIIYATTIEGYDKYKYLGYLFKGPNGNKIFLPYTTYIQPGWGNANGLYYWSSTYSDKSGSQCVYYNGSTQYLPHYCAGFTSMPIRPVKDAPTVIPGWKDLGILSDNGKTLLWSEFDVVAINEGIATLATDNASYHSVLNSGLFTWAQATSITGLANFPEGVTGTVRLPSYSEVGRLKNASNRKTFQWINSGIKGGQITLNEQTIFFPANGYYSGSLINSAKSAHYWCGTEADHGQLIINNPAVGHNYDRGDTDGLSVRLVIEVSTE